MAISDRVGVDTSGYQPIVVPPPSNAQLEQPLLPVRDSKIRFSAPNIPGSFPSSDTLIGYHLGGQIPQYRIPVPPSQTSGGASTATASIVSSSSSTTTNNPPIAQTTSATTSVLSPGGEFQGVIHMAKAFVVLTVTVSIAARVRFYGTNMAQIIDAGRPISQGPGFGTEQNIVGDIVLDTPPVVWQAVDMVGANGDNPQSTAVYITVDNLSNMSTAVTVSVVFVPIQS